MMCHVTFLSEGKALSKPKEWCWIRLWEQERQAHTPHGYLFFQVPGGIKSSPFRTGGPRVAQLPPCRRYVSLRNWQMGGSALVSITGKWHRGGSSCVSLSKWESIWLSVCVVSSRSSWSPYFWTHHASSWMTNDQDRPHHSVHIALQCLSHDEYFLVDGHEHVTLKIPSHFLLTPMYPPTCIPLLPMSLSPIFSRPLTNWPGHWPLSKSLYIFSSWATSSSMTMKLQPLGRASCIAVCICTVLLHFLRIRITHWQGRSSSTGHFSRSLLVTSQQLGHHCVPESVVAFLLSSQQNRLCQLILWETGAQ